MLLMWSVWKLLDMVWILWRKFWVVKCFLLRVFGGVFEVVVRCVLVGMSLLRSCVIIMVLFGLLSLNLLMQSRLVFFRRLIVFLYLSVLMRVVYLMNDLKYFWCVGMVWQIEVSRWVLLMLNLLLRQMFGLSFGFFLVWLNRLLCLVGVLCLVKCMSVCFVFFWDGYVGLI